MSSYCHVCPSGLRWPVPETQQVSSYFYIASQHFAHNRFLSFNWNCSLHPPMSMAGIVLDNHCEEAETAKHFRELLVKLWCWDVVTRKRGMDRHVTKRHATSHRLTTPVTRNWDPIEWWILGPGLGCHHASDLTIDLNHFLCWPGLGWYVMGWHVSWNNLSPVLSFNHDHEQTN